MQQYAVYILLQNHSTCFGCLPHPSSGVHKSVVTATGTSTLVPVAVTTVLCTPDDGCGRHPKHVE